MEKSPQFYAKMAEARKKQQAENARIRQANLPDDPARKAQLAQRKTPPPELAVPPPKQVKPSKDFYKKMAEERKKLQAENRGRRR